MLRRTRPAMLAVALSLAIAGCSSNGSSDDGTASPTGSEAPAASGSESGGGGELLPADQAATVNGEVIANDLFVQLADAARAQTEDQLSQAASEGASAPADEAQFEEQRRQVLSSLILSELVRQFAADRDVVLTDEDIETVVEDGGEELATAAEGSGLSPEEYARLFPAQDVLINRVVDQALEGIELTPEMLAGETTATLSHILVETEEEANAVLERIEGGEDFAAVATETSIDGSAAQGGSLGEDVPLSGFVPAFAEAAAAAPLNEPVGPVETEFGYHIILVTDRTEVDADNVTDEQRRNALATSEEGQAAIAPLSQEFQTALTESDVVVSSRYGEWDAANQSVVAEGQVGAGQTAPPVGTEAPPVGTEAPPAGTEAPAPAPSATE